MTEHAEQVALFDRARLNEAAIPELRLLFAVPNGALRPYKTRRGADGREVRYSPIGQKLAEEGVKRGVPDVWLPVARGGYHGLVIEMKCGSNKPTAEQVVWLDALAAEGWLAIVCWTHEEAWGVILEYLERKGSQCTT
jgi:hypothetical protein